MNGMPGKTVRLLSYAVLAVLAVCVAVAGALVQSGWFPFGLLLGLAGTAALFCGGAALTRTRAGAGVPAAFWLLTVIAMTVNRPEGDAIFAADLAPYLYLFGGALSGVICTTWPRSPGGASPDVRIGR